MSPNDIVCKRCKGIYGCIEDDNIKECVTSKAQYVTICPEFKDCTIRKGNPKFDNINGLCQFCKERSIS